MISAMSKLSDWLNKEIGKRGWSYREFARRAGISSGTVSNVLSDRTRPSWEFYEGTAKALRMPLEDVLRQAGLLPPKYDENPSARELLWRFMQLSEEEQEFIILTAEALLERKRRREAEEKEQTAKHPEIRPADAGTGP